MRTVSARCLYGCCVTPQRNIWALSWYMAVLFRQYTENICFLSKISTGGLCDWGILLVIYLAVFKFVVDTRFQLERRALWRLSGGLATILQNWISCNEQKMREAHITRRGTSFYLLIFIEKIINRKIEHSQSKSLLPVESSTAACSGNARSITSGSGKPWWGTMQGRRLSASFPCGPRIIRGRRQGIRRA